MIKILEGNILPIFGCPNNIITHNVRTFKPNKMVEFFNKYNVKFGHSSTYYPLGNGLAKSSNKILVNIVKNLLQDNKNPWHNKLINALWVDIVTTKKSIAMSPLQLVYGIDVIFPISLGIPIFILLQDSQVEPNDP